MNTYKIINYEPKQPLIFNFAGYNFTPLADYSKLIKQLPRKAKMTRSTEGKWIPTDDPSQEDISNLVEI